MNPLKTVPLHEAFNVYHEVPNQEVPIPLLKASPALHTVLLGLGLAKARYPETSYGLDTLGLSTRNRYRQLRRSVPPLLKEEIWKLSDIIETVLPFISLRNEPVFLKKTKKSFSPVSLYFDPRLQLVFALAKEDLCAGSYKKGARISSIPYDTTQQPFPAYEKISKKCMTEVRKDDVTSEETIDATQSQRYSDVFVRELRAVKAFGPELYVTFQSPEMVIDHNSVRCIRRTHSIEKAYTGDLEYISNRLSDTDLICLFHSLLSELRAMHEVSIIHGDIKPANILWEKTPDKGLVGKFTDFGFTFDPRISLHFTLETQGFYGSVTPTAPEVLRSPSPFSGDCFAAEMWALGYSLFLPMFGELPPWGSKILAHREGKDGCSAKDFPDIIEQMIRHEIQKRQRLLEGWTSRRASLAHICLSMLSINPLERPTAAQAEQRVREVREKTFIPRV